MRRGACLEGDTVNFPLIPNFYFDSIFAIDLARLRARGVKLLLADLDNTLVPYGVHTPPPEIEALFLIQGGAYPSSDPFNATECGQQQKNDPERRSKTVLDYQLTLFPLF